MIHKIHEKLEEEVDAYIMQMFGTRCQRFMLGCACCMAWDARDRLFGFASYEEPYKYALDGDSLAPLTPSQGEPDDLDVNAGTPPTTPDE